MDETENVCWMSALGRHFLPVPKNVIMSLEV